MGQVEPDGDKPDDVEHREDGIAERLDDVTVTVTGIAGTHVGVADEFGKHHVVPEVVEVKKQTYDHDYAQHEHVLRGPFHFSGTVGHGVAVTAARFPVLERQDDGVDEMDGHQGCQHERSGHSIPVGAEHFAHCVIGFFREERYDVHARMERQEQDKRDACNRHDYLSSD